ncbi:MAG: hypothetical protein SGPRY_006202 [Prymnesium sp.]
MFAKPKRAASRKATTVLDSSDEDSDASDSDSDRDFDAMEVTFFSAGGVSVRRFPGAVSF